MLSLLWTGPYSGEPAVREVRWEWEGANEVKHVTTERGFQRIESAAYLSPAVLARVAQQSSVIGDYTDSFDRPGTSALWVGSEHHLNREEVAELRDALTHWLDTGKLFAVVPHPLHEPELGTPAGA